MGTLRGLAESQAVPGASQEAQDMTAWLEYEAFEAYTEVYDDWYCPVCGSISPGHITEDDDGPCREHQPLFSYYG